MRRRVLPIRIVFSDHQVREWSTLHPQLFAQVAWWLDQPNPDIESYEYDPNDLPRTDEAGPHALNTMYAPPLTEAEYRGWTIKWHKLDRVCERIPETTYLVDGSIKTAAGTVLRTGRGWSKNHAAADLIRQLEEYEHPQGWNSSANSDDEESPRANG